MLKGAVAGRYAEALYEIALKEKLVDQLEAELKSVVEVIEGSEQLKKVLFHPRITAAEKKEVLNGLFKDHISGIAMDFLGLVVDRQREVYIADITAYFTGLANKARNISDVQVTSAVELTKEEKKKLAAVLAKSTGKKVKLSYNVDKELLGGLVVRVGDKVIDGSVRTRLQTLREHLRQIS
ncbi:ATP synthase F1 subunit delta [Desulfallas thermosapovorans]|uniref:ATP synthase subunit delta n=1 Tax=Desulfallas thermosapovorans DSM 6562 TaxID=1121431 RepID=A0A5S4ZWT2_9FIRM|nr:ATP synthase F1 subunit delta [Desulfallas thermosapovorans]TYO96563.1 ATP synthase F1 subcomplex delta subunit [Desulfallas thermosapovorans DSM 6562]